MLLSLPSIVDSLCGLLKCQCWGICEGQSTRMCQTDGWIPHANIYANKTTHVGWENSSGFKVLVFCYCQIENISLFIKIVFCCCIEFVFQYLIFLKFLVANIPAEGSNQWRHSSITDVRVVCCTDGLQQTLGMQHSGNNVNIPHVHIY